MAVAISAACSTTFPTTAAALPLHTPEHLFSQLPIQLLPQVLTQEPEHINDADVPAQLVLHV
jgi:hypothetical protein